MFYPHGNINTLNLIVVPVPTFIRNFNALQNFTDCACVPEGGWATHGACDYNCEMFPIYCAVLVVAMLLSAATSPAVLALVLR